MLLHNPTPPKRKNLTKIRVPPQKNYFFLILFVNAIFAEKVTHNSNIYTAALQRA